MMKIVIDINEHLYKMIKTAGLVVDDEDAVAVSEAIMNGTPLPKGHGKLVDISKIEKDKILKALAEDRNDYARDCTRRIAEENGKITGADYMLQRFLDVLNTEVEPQESEDKNE